MPIKNRPPSMKRQDRDGTHRGTFEKNKKRIYATQTMCGICGSQVDMNLKYPNPMSKCIDHIIPISKGGHPSDIDNLQLAHMACNRQKSDKTFINPKETKPKVIGNRNLPQTKQWSEYKA